MTLAEYSTSVSSLLSFPKGAVIKLQPKAHLERGGTAINLYQGSHGYPVWSPGWLFGEFEGRVGIFPEEYIVPLVSWGEAPSEKSVMVSGHLGML